MPAPQRRTSGPPWPTCQPYAASTPPPRNLAQPRTASTTPSHPQAPYACVRHAFPLHAYQRRHRAWSRCHMPSAPWFCRLPRHPPPGPVVHGHATCTFGPHVAPESCAAHLGGPLSPLSHAMPLALSPPLSLALPLSLASPLSLAPRDGKHESTVENINPQWKMKMRRLGRKWTSSQRGSGCEWEGQPAWNCVEAEKAKKRL